MKRALQSFALAVFTVLTMGPACPAQNGPTMPSVVLTWTQSSSTGVTKNCIYRGTVAGTYGTAISCIPVGTTYTDSGPVAGTTYFYAVTAQVGSAESAYSLPAQVVVPANPNAPTNLNAPTVTKNELPKDGTTTLQGSTQESYTVLMPKNKPLTRNDCFSSSYKGGGLWELTEIAQCNVPNTSNVQAKVEWVKR